MPKATGPRPGFRKMLSIRVWEPIKSSADRVNRLKRFRSVRCKIAQRLHQRDFSHLLAGDVEKGDLDLNGAESDRLIVGGRPANFSWIGIFIAGVVDDVVSETVAVIIDADFSGCAVVSKIEWPEGRSV